MSPSIEQRARFDFVRYASVWEDADVLCGALSPLAGKRVLSVASAGDNAFALLGEGATVVAADLNPAQLACVELRRAAFRALEYEELFRFLGIRTSDDRAAVFERLARDLPPSVREFWKAHPEEIAGGIIHVGRFERYFHRFRRFLLPIIHGPEKVRALLEHRAEEGRRRFYRETWNNRRWRLLFRIFFSRFVMGRLGRDPEFFRFVEGSVSDRILSRAEYALTALPTDENPWLEYILTGNFSHALPRYLQPGRFDAIRKGLDRLTLYHGPIEEAARIHGTEGFGGFNLSDIFEYMDEATTETVYRKLLAHARRGARFVYWNMLVPRKAPPSLAPRIRLLRELSGDLQRKDRAFFYSAVVVEEVLS